MMMLYVFRGIDGSKEKEKHRQISEKHGDSGKKHILPLNWNHLISVEGFNIYHRDFLEQVH